MFRSLKPRIAITTFAVVLAIGLAWWAFDTWRGHGQLTVSIDDPVIAVTLEDKELVFSQRPDLQSRFQKAELLLRPGTYRLTVAAGKRGFQTHPFEIRRDQTHHVSIRNEYESLFARSGHRMIGMDPWPEPSGPVTIQAPSGRYWHAGNEGITTVDKSVEADATSFTLRWQKHDQSEGTIQSQDGSYVSSSPAGSYYLSEIPEDASLFHFHWSDRELGHSRIMNQDRVYVTEDSERGRLALGGSLGDEFRIAEAVTADAPAVDVQSVQQTGGLEHVKRFKGHQGTITDLAFSNNGQFIAAASGSPQGDKTARVWKINSGELIQTFQHLKQVEAVTFSPDDTEILTGRASVAARILSLKTGQETARFKCGEGPVRDVVFLPGGQLATSQRIATLCFVANESMRLRIWDVPSGKKIREFSYSVGGFEPTGSLAASSDGKHLIAAVGRTLLALDTSKWGTVFKLRASTPVRAVALSADGKFALISTLSPDAQVSLLRTSDGTILRNFPEASPATRVEFLPTGKHFVTCGPGNPSQICVWDLADGSLIASATRDEETTSLAIAPDGRHIATGGGVAWQNRSGKDLDVHLWKLPQSTWPDLSPPADTTPPPERNEVTGKP